MHLDEYPIVGDGRHLNVSNVQHVGGSGAVLDECFHRAGEFDAGYALMAVVPF
jgi:hypothetical protein